MPKHNQFRHQTYTSDRPTSPYHLVAAGPTRSDKAEEDGAALARAGKRFRDAKVRRIYLVHGTFAGDDALGLVGGLQRLYPAAGDWMAQLSKQAVDHVVGDMGNYTPVFARRLEEGIAETTGDLDRPIKVRRFLWSSENLHVARAHAAIRLLVELCKLDLTSGDRVLLWGHSHAGNVFALMTNLLGASQKSRSRFFAAARPYYMQRGGGNAELHVWEKAKQLLAKGRMPLADQSLDIVTFGTPIRYGWDLSVCRSLLHVVHHCPQNDLPEYLAPFPPSMEQVLSAATGDIVQQVFIAGTNLTPPLLSLRTWRAEESLRRLIQSGIRRRDLLQRLSLGQRVPADGTTLLVDYGPIEGNPAQHLAGHAVYTRERWLAFHAEVVAQYLYGEDEA